MSRLQSQAETQTLCELDASRRHSCLRQVHERLVDFISQRAALSRTVLSLADAVVDFYSPKDDGFAPAIAFQTMAADGTSGLLGAQLQALIQTALKPLARHIAELGQIDALVKSSKRREESEHHYARKVNELNSKLEIERREDKRALLQEKAARNINKLTAARLTRKEASDELYRLVETSKSSSHAFFNPVFTLICQFQEATSSHEHLLSSMLLRIVRNSVGTTSLPMATIAAAPPAVSVSPARSSMPMPSAASPVQESKAEGVLVWRDDGGGRGSQACDGDAAVAPAAHCCNEAGDDQFRVVHVEAGGDASPCDRDVAVSDAAPPDPGEKTSNETSWAAGTAGAPASEKKDRSDSGVASLVERALAKADTVADAEAAASAGKTVNPLMPAPPLPVRCGKNQAAHVARNPSPPCPQPSRDAEEEPPAALEATMSRSSTVDGAAGAAAVSKVSSLSPILGEAQSRPAAADAFAHAIVGDDRNPSIRARPHGPFLEAHLPWGKRRRMSGSLRWKISGGGRSARQVFCVAEGRELVTYDTEGDANAGLPPRSRYLLLDVRSVPASRGSLELEVIVADPSEVATLGWGRRVSLPTGTNAAAGLPFVETRTGTLAAAGRHEHARWALALDETKSWKEETEREALLEELELSLGFREHALGYVRHTLPDDVIEHVLGVTAAGTDPGCVLKSAVFDAAAASSAAAGARNYSGAAAAPAPAASATSPEQTADGGPVSGYGGGGTVNTSSGGGAASQRSMGVPSSSFRGLLSIFDSARSPRGGAGGGGGDETGGAFVHAESIGGGGGNVWGGGGAQEASVGDGTSGVSRRWGRRGKGKAKRGSSTGRTRRRGRGADAFPVGIGRSLHGDRGRDARGDGGGGSGGGSGGGPMEFGSPIRRHSLADPSLATLRASFGLGGGAELDACGLGGLGPGVDPPGACIGGGHALCRSRSRSTNGAMSDVLHTDSEPTASAQYQPRQSRHPSRERSLILEFVQGAGGGYPPHSQAISASGCGGGGGGRIYGGSSSCGAETGAESSAPSTPNGRLGLRRTSSARRVGSNRLDSYRRKGSYRPEAHRLNSHRRESVGTRRYNSGGAWAPAAVGGCAADLRAGGWSAPGERSILGVPASYASDGSSPPVYWHMLGSLPAGASATGGPANAGVGEYPALARAEAGRASGVPAAGVDVLRGRQDSRSRHSGINPYLTRRPATTLSPLSGTVAPCRSLSDSCRPGAGPALSENAVASPEQERPAGRGWGIWFKKGEMPALPRKRQSPTSAGNGTASGEGDESGGDGKGEPTLVDDEHVGLAAANGDGQNAPAGSDWRVKEKESNRSRGVGPRENIDDDAADGGAATLPTAMCGPQASRDAEALEARGPREGSGSDATWPHLSRRTSPEW